MALWIIVALLAVIAWLCWEAVKNLQAILHLQTENAKKQQEMDSLAADLRHFKKLAENREKSSG